MKDIAINIDQQSSSFMDIILAPDEDFAEDFEAKQIVLNEVMEQFDMTIGDDIDFPATHSKQMANFQSDDTGSDLKRISDAERILKEHPLIDSDTVTVDLNDKNQIVVNFNLLPDNKIEKYLMK